MEAITTTAGQHDLLVRAVSVFEAEGAIATHLFGSLARCDGDALSDVDLWITVPDHEIDRMVERRFQTFADIAEVVILHEAPRNRPLSGSYTLVIHRLGDALIQVDYYLVPASTTVIPPEARLLSGNSTLPRGPWFLDVDALVVENLSERLDFLICMSFIGVKKILRGDQAFLSFLNREHERFRTTYDVPVDSIVLTADLDSLARLLHSLRRSADGRQRLAIQAALDEMPRQAYVYAEHGDAPA